jgi:16S rRNA (uracil1498-N3)-methyltransferase
MSERFYINCSLQLGPVSLAGVEAHHLAVVCRLGPGDLVCLFNGDGHEYPARIGHIERRRVELEVVERLTPVRELLCRLEVAAPMPKGDRAQFLVEKLTELGVTRFVPLTTTHSVVHPREAKLEKLQRHVIEASKQCGRNVLMEVDSLTKWEDYCGRGDLPARRWFGHPGGNGKLKDFWGNGEASELAWAVGPEGGFTDDEVQAALSAGWKAVDLGPRVLRVETAALVLPAVASGQGTVNKR